MKKIKKSPDKTIMKIALKDLYIDDSYQRILDIDWCRKQAAEYDPLLMTTLLVGDKNKQGKYPVIDGMHRTTILQMVGERHAECEVRHGLTEKQQAKLFDDYNFKRRPMKTLDRVKPRIRYEDPTIIDIKKIVERYGFCIVRNDTGRRTYILAVDAIEKAYKKLGAVDFENMFKVINKCWGKNKDAVQKKLIDGLAHFIHQHRGDIDWAHLVKCLGRSTPNQILADASANDKVLGRISSVSWVIINNYNKNKRYNRLTLATFCA